MSSEFFGLSGWSSFGSVRRVFLGGRRRDFQTELFSLSCPLQHFLYVIITELESGTLIPER